MRMTTRSSGSTRTQALISGGGAAPWAMASPGRATWKPTTMPPAAAAVPPRKLRREMSMARVMAGSFRTALRRQLA